MRRQEHCDADDESEAREGGHAKMGVGHRFSFALKSVLDPHALGARRG
jgi:hypothetical protein